VLHLAARGEDEHSGGGGFFAQVAEDAQSIQLGQVQVEHDQIHRMVESGFESRGAVEFRGDGMPPPGQRASDVTRQLPFIFDDQDAHRAIGRELPQIGDACKANRFSHDGRVWFSRMLVPRFGWRSVVILSLSAVGTLCAQPDASPLPTVQELAKQNRLLQEQVTQQQKIIDALQARLSALEERTSASSGSGPAAAPASTPVAASGPEPVPSSAGGGEMPVRISAEVGLAYFQSGSDGQFPNGEFRVDEARVYLEAPVWGNVFFHSETDLVTRETADNDLHLGEVYADVESIAGPWADDHLLNLRVGRIYIPFGEEYQVRNVMEDPLISHSVSDIWGMDGGIEAYGSSGKFSYASALLDGGLNPLHNFHTSKSAAGRIGYAGSNWWKVSASAMRTGRLSASGDPLSAVWFGNGFFKSLGPGATKYWANLFEADAAANWHGGSLTAAAGQAQFDDDGHGNDYRRMNYFSLQGIQHLTDQLYGGLRWSAVHAPGGYYLEGQGVSGEYFFSNVLTKQLERLSVGLGYRFADPLVFKIEYSPEWGSTVSSGSRDEANLFSSELGLKF